MKLAITFVIIFVSFNKLLKNHSFPRHTAFTLGIDSQTFFLVEVYQYKKTDYF